MLPQSHFHNLFVGSRDFLDIRHSTDLASRLAGDVVAASADGAGLDDGAEAEGGPASGVGGQSQVHPVQVLGGCA